MQKICIVIPCYNEELRFDNQHLLNFIQATRLDVTFCLVNDGSTDNTLDKLKLFSSLHPDKILVLDLPENSGKSEAVRIGILKMFESNKFTHLGFWDADFSTPINEIDSFVHYFNNNTKIKMVIGSRFKRLGAKIERKKMRHILGRVFSTFASIILKLPVYDTQCGAKLFSAEIVPIAFENKFISNWLFDIEIIARIRNKFSKQFVLDSVIELPLIHWKEIAGSKLKLKHMIKVPLDLLRINNKYN